MGRALPAIETRIGAEKMAQPIDPTPNLSSLITQLVVGGNLDLCEEPVIPPLKGEKFPSPASVNERKKR